jgi:hypothetical protein
MNIRWAILFLAALAIAGCGDIKWFPSSSSSSGNTTLSPKPSNDVATDVQADTVIDKTYFKTLPYQVRFNNLTTNSLTTTISISGDTTSQYSIDGGTTWIGVNAATGTVSGGTNVLVRQTSSNDGSNRTIISTLNIGGNIATYASTTGSLVFPTIGGTSAGMSATSATSIVPSTFPNGFTFPARISVASDSTALNIAMYINDPNETSPSPNNSLIQPGDRLHFKHTATSSPTSLTHATITGSNNVTYDVTFKSTIAPVPQR